MFLVDLEKQDRLINMYLENASIFFSYIQGQEFRSSVRLSVRINKSARTDPFLRSRELHVKNHRHCFACGQLMR